MNRLKALSAIGFLIALLMLSGCANQGAAAGTNATRSAAPAATKVASPRRPTVDRGGPATGMTIMHTVQEGENLYRIARKYGTSVQAIQQANGITDPDADHDRPEIDHSQSAGDHRTGADRDADDHAHARSATPRPTTPIVYTATPRRPDRHNRSECDADVDAHALADAAAAG